MLEEIKDLELEIEQIQVLSFNFNRIYIYWFVQNAHGLEIQSHKDEFERQLRALRERVESEENANQKLQDELKIIHNGAIR